jgi:uncharacterized protein
VITLDTSAIYALLSRTDSHHKIVINVLASEQGPRVIPVFILAEVAHMVELRHGHSALDRFLADVERARYLLDCGEQDVPRVRELTQRYSDLPLGFADAAVIACAERRGGKVLTYDQRHFPVVAREGTFEILGA